MAIKIEGLDKLIKDLQKFEKDGAVSVKRNIEFSATNIEVGAVRDAPALPDDIGEDGTLSIKQRIDKKIENRGLTAQVGIQSVRQEGEFAVWYEFGTGLSAEQLLNGPNYTDDIRKLASIFIRNRKGTIKQQAYLFPNFFRESPKLIEKLKKDLDNLAKKV
jgi:hypothetical protein